MVKFITKKFLSKNMQHFNPWAGGDGTFLILSHLQLDSKYEKQ